MADKELRALANAYFRGDYDRETYQQQRTELIDQIIEESRVSSNETTSGTWRIAKYVIAVVVIILVIIGGILTLLMFRE